MDGDPPAGCAGGQRQSAGDARLHDDDGRNAGWRSDGIAQREDGDGPGDELNGEGTEQMHGRMACAET